jgi:hypothetical protein
MYSLNTSFNHCWIPPFMGFNLAIGKTAPSILSIANAELKP